MRDYKKIINFILWKSRKIHCGLLIRDFSIRPDLFNAWQCDSIEHQRRPLALDVFRFLIKIK